MKKWMLTLAFLIVGLSATSAFAKDLCVLDNQGGNVLKFDGVKLLKGKSTPLVGRINLSNSADNHPIYGVVTLDSDNLTTRTVLTFSNVNVAAIVIINMIGDKNFNAAGSAQSLIGAGSFAYTWTSFPCNLAAAANVYGTPVGPNPFLPQ